MNLPSVGAGAGAGHRIDADFIVEGLNVHDFIVELRSPTTLRNRGRGQISNPWRQSRRQDDPGIGKARRICLPAYFADKATLW